MADFVLNETDLSMRKRLESWLPDKIFDMHAHLHNAEHHRHPDSICTAYGTADARRFLEDQKLLYGNRRVRGLLIPMPNVDFSDHSLIDAVNTWITAEVQKVPDCAAEVFVKPEDTRADIEKLLVSPQIKGFKCYYLAIQKDIAKNQADIGEYLPEAAWEIANERGFVITLHLVKDKALADPSNLAYIKEKAAKYPNAKLILAHCARGFASWTVVETVRQLKEFPNIYYDLAAICEIAPMYEVIRQAGADHVFWGTDYCIGMKRGKAFSSGMKFEWVYTEELPQGLNFPACLVTLESLFAFYQTCVMLDLTRQQVEDIFYNNAVGVLGLEP